MRGIARVPWGCLLLLVGLGCVGPAFRLPTLPSFPALARRPAVPSGELVSGAVPNGVTDVQSARATLLRRDTSLAVGPIVAGSRDLSLALLGRLLARRGARVLDLSAAGDLTLAASSSRLDPALNLRGPWRALVWASRWGDASMLLLSDPVVIGRVADPRQARLRYDPDALSSYQTARDSLVGECEVRLPRMEAEQRRVEGEYREARREYVATRTWVDRMGRDTGEEGARQAVEESLRALEVQRAACAAALRELPSAEVLTGRAASQNERDARTMAQASGSFRVVALPGGEVLWTASLARRGDDDEAALANLLDAVVDTLHGDRRTPTLGDDAPTEPIPTGPVASPPRRSHRRRH